MKYKIANINENSEESIKDSKRGLFLYDKNNNEFYINVTKEGYLRITSHDGNICVIPQSMNQLIIKLDE